MYVCVFCLFFCSISEDQSFIQNTMLSTTWKRNEKRNQSRIKITRYAKSTGNYVSEKLCWSSSLGRTRSKRFVNRKSKQILTIKFFHSRPSTVHNHQYNRGRKKTNNKCIFIREKNKKISLIHAPIHIVFPCRRRRRQHSKRIDDVKEMLSS